MARLIKWCLYLFLLQVTALEFGLIRLVRADCWRTGCQLNSWAVTGCQQYGRVETGRSPCNGGTVFTCCTPNGGPTTTTTKPTTSTWTPTSTSTTTTTTMSAGSSGNWKSGDITYYNLGMTACGQSFTDSDLVAAIAFSYWTTPNPNLDPMCGRSALVQDPTTGKSVTVRIWDKCGGCKDGDIDMSPTAFQRLRELGVGRFKGQWKFI